MKKFASAGVIAVALLAAMYAGSALFSQPRAEAEGQLVGFVDSDRIMEKYAPAVEVNSQLVAMRKKSEADLEKAVRAKYGSGDVSMLPRESQMEIQKMLDKAEKDFDAKSDKLRAEKWAPIVKKVNDNVSKAAQAEKLQVVVDKAVVIYGGVDLTDKVLARLSSK